jgi:flagellin
MAINVNITSAAAKAEITNQAAFTSASAATASLKFAASATLTLSDTSATTDIHIRAASTSAAYDGATIAVVSGGALGASYNAGSNTLTITYDGTSDTAGDIAQAINDTGLFVATAGTPADVVDEASDPTFDTLAQGAVNLTAATSGADFNNVSIRLETANGVGGTPSVAYSADTKELVVTVDDTSATNLTAIATAITNYQYNGAAIFTAAAVQGGAMADIDPTGADVDAQASTGTTGGALLKGDLVLELSGKTGMEVFNFQKDASLDMIAAAINLVSDATGVAAAYTGNTLTLNSTEYGSAAFVAANVLSEESTGAFLSGLSARRDAGQDIVATVNGIAATGTANNFSVNTSTLDMTVSVVAGSSTDFAFTITGGGGLFQIGPDVVSNQQARLGIGSVNSARLGGTSGKLYQLATGEAASLENDATKAASIVEEALNKVTSLRGRLGAFQRTTLDANAATLSDTLEALTDAESTIRDADFAKETAALTRSQILVQSGISVLGIANQNPQNVLALLR